MMTRSIASIAVALFLAFGFGPASAATPAGDWLGALTIRPGVSLRVALHIEETTPGNYTATWDSVDQGLFDGPVSALTISPTSLAFDIERPKARFAATWDAAAGAWVGQWTQGGGSLPLTLTRGLAPPGPTVTGLDGDWDGALDVSGMKLRLVFHIKTGRHGTIGTLDSIDQGALGTPISSVERDGDKVTFGVKVVGGGFKGDLDAKGQVIAGRWSQGGQEIPLTLTRRAAGTPEATLNRPQTPKPPYPYLEEDIGFETPGAKAHLAGTLTLPKGARPFPAVILVAGSGPNTRDEPIFGHRLFLVIADHLTRAGVAVLRYDKRGVGASTGDYAQATTEDFADDAASAVAYLKTRKEIDPHRIGLIGHSEGGLIVPIVAVRDPSVAFIVLMAGPGVNGAEVWIEQLRLILLASGMDAKAVDELVVRRRKMVAALRAEPDPAKAAVALRAIMPADTPTDQSDALIKVINTPWFRSFFEYDPAPTLAKLRCPVLALAGSKDLQVSPPQNLPALRAALAHDPDATVEELPDLNHLFQTAKTGGIGEYAEIEETISPAALDIITAWILKHAGLAAG